MSKCNLISQYISNNKHDLYQSNGKAKFPSDKIWTNIAKAIKNEHNVIISPKYIYNMVNSNKTNITDDFNDENKSSSSSTVNSDIGENTSEPTELNFVITLSIEEWNLIKPTETYYSRKNSKNLRRYSILAQGKWTELFFSHFWQHTKLNCALTFKKAKVYECGNNYLEIFAKCTECESLFFSHLKEKPEDNTRVLFSCRYVGNFDKKHFKKRYLSGNTRRAMADNMLFSNIMPSAYRRTMANKLMSVGDIEPPHLPTGNTLRVAVHEALKSRRPAENLYDSLYKAKYLYPYNEYIQDIGIDKFFVHYWSTLQIHVYNAYTKSGFSKIAIDATGNVVRKIMRPSGYLSAYIFLYDVAVCDPKSKMQYSVCNMLSERHDSDSISLWLKRWIRDGANTPTEIVCDMSVALLSAITKSFLEMSLTSYVNFCYNIVSGKCMEKPKVFIRSDVAHVINMFLRWKCFKNTARRTKEFYVRSLAQLLLCTDFDFAKRILTAIFSVALCETDGNDAQGYPNFCDIQKIWLKDLISHGYETNLEKIILDTITTYDTKDIEISQHLPPHEIFNEEESLFFSWSSTILEETKLKIIVDGDRDNMQFLPEIVKPVMNLIKLLPLWSGIMTPHLKHSGSTCSSASVESNFNDIKNRIFSNKTLPIRIDDFLCQHIISIEGTMKLAASATKNYYIYSHGKKENLDAINIENVTNKKEEQNLDDIIVEDEIIINPNKFEVLSQNEESLHNMETLHVENFRGQGVIKLKRPRKSYLETQSEWEHINLSDSTTAIPIALLKNGSSLSLRPIKVGKQNYYISNTCGFDCVLQLFCAAYCDNSSIKQHIDYQTDEDFKYLIKNLTIHGRTSRYLYVARAKILANILPSTQQPNNILHIDAACTIKNLLNLMKQYISYSICETELCSTESCKSEKIHEAATISIILKDKTIDRLAEEIQFQLNKTKNSKCIKCNNNTTVTYKLNKNIIFIEIMDKHGNDLNINLCTIPGYLKFTEFNIECTYILQGIVAITGDDVNNLGAIGHFIAYVLRPNGKWEIYNDLKEKVETKCSLNRQVKPVIMMYRVNE